jgi:hypothetical protein
MTSTELDRSPAETPGLFDAGPGQMLDVATDVANRFADIVKQQKMSTPISGRDHINVEAWQTIGAMTGVFVTDRAAHVEELPWRREPAEPGPEPNDPQPTDPQGRAAWEDRRKAWELRRDLRQAWELGLAFGYRASLAVERQGIVMGWAESAADRTEDGKTTMPDFQLRSWAQTRAQSRALAMPLRWTVKLAGYETTPAEDMLPNGAAPAAPASQWGEVTQDDKDLEQAAKIVTALGVPEAESAAFVLAMGQVFDGVPVACMKMLRGLYRKVGDARAKRPDDSEMAPPDPSISPYHQGPPDDVVYPPGHYQGD